MFNAPRLRETGNLLLDRLPLDEFDRLQPSLQRVSLTLKQVVHRFGDEIAYVFFPTTAMLSLLTVMEDDDPIEIATVGFEGVVGNTTILDVRQALHQSFCQMPGESFRLPAARFIDATKGLPIFSHLMARYHAYCFLSVAQTVACNSLHAVEARFCRWLLMVHDQARKAEFQLTQEFLAVMLGVRRQTVTVVAGSLQGAGLIEVRRGTIRIIDRPRLEAGACACYRLMKDRYTSLFGEEGR